jgi:hypothetical protein
VKRRGVEERDARVALPQTAVKGAGRKATEAELPGWLPKGTLPFVFEAGIPMGIGLEFNSRGVLAVVEVDPGSPAHLQGVKVGSELVAVREHATSGMSKADVLQLLASCQGTRLLAFIPPTSHPETAAETEPVAPLSVAQRKANWLSVTGGRPGTCGLSVAGKKKAPTPGKRPGGRLGTLGWPLGLFCVLLSGSALVGVRELPLHTLANHAPSALVVSGEEVVTRLAEGGREAHATVQRELAALYSMASDMPSIVVGSGRELGIRLAEGGRQAHSEFVALYSMLRHASALVSIGRQGKQWVGQSLNVTWLVAAQAMNISS